MNTAITKQNNSIVMPAVSPDEAVKAFDSYQELSKRIMRPEDVQNIQGKEFKKKSFWRKCQRFFNLSIERVEEVRVEDKNGGFTYKFVFRATAPNGSYMDGTGTCSSNEKGLLKTEHNTRAIAETRAKNRAIADLVAFGEVSAEEINGDEVEHTSEQVKTSDQNKCAECGTTNKYHKKGCKSNPITLKEFDDQQLKQQECEHVNEVELTTKKEGKNKGRVFLKCNDCDAFRGWKDEREAEEAEAEEAQSRFAESGY